MENRIKSLDVNFGNFYLKASELYCIPSLQRPYSWDQKQVEKLFDDIIDNDSPYYIGSIVMVAAEGSVGYEQVVDGQQRLTTLSLILIGLRKFILGKKGKKFKEIDDAILNLLFRPRHNVDKQIRLLFSNENSKSIYTILANGGDAPDILTEIQSRFVNNLEYIMERLKEYSPGCNIKDISNLFEKINSLSLIFISCINKSAAYKLFESINATGISLASTDMIKNSIFESLENNQSNLRIAEEKWNEILDVFNEDTSMLKTYIRHHWISTVGYISHSKMFDAYVKKYKKEKQALEYINLLTKSSHVYQALRTCAIDGLKKLPKKRFERNEIREVLEFIKFLGVDQIYSVLLNIYENRPHEFKEFVIRLAAFQFLYKYVPGSPSVPEKKFFADFCAKKIDKTKLFSGLLNLCINNELHFKQNLIEKIKYKEGLSGHIQFILEKYLYYLGGSRKFNKPTIDHIIAQDLNDDVITQFGGNIKLAKQLIQKIGNLTILEATDNSSDKYSNLVFKDRIPSYKKDVFIGNNKIIDYCFESDPQTAIKHRGDDVAGELYQIFIKALKTGKWPVNK